MFWKTREQNMMFLLLAHFLRLICSWSLNLLIESALLYLTAFELQQQGMILDTAIFIGRKYNNVRIVESSDFSCKSTKRCFNTVSKFNGR